MTRVRPQAVQADPEHRLLLRTRLNAAACAYVAEVRLTPALYGGGTVWCAMALAADRRELPLPKGAARVISGLMRAAFPTTRWDRPQDYDVTTGVLAEHVTLVPAALTGSAR